MMYNPGDKVWTLQDRLPFRVSIVGVSTLPGSGVVLYEVSPTHRRMKFTAFRKEGDLYRSVNDLLHSMAH